MSETPRTWSHEGDQYVALIDGVSLCLNTEMAGNYVVQLETKLAAAKRENDALRKDAEKLLLDVLELVSQIANRHKISDRHVQVADELIPRISAAIDAISGKRGES